MKVLWRFWFPACADTYPSMCPPSRTVFVWYLSTLKRMLYFWASHLIWITFEIFIKHRRHFDWIHTVAEKFGKMRLISVSFHGVNLRILTQSAHFVTIISNRYIATFFLDISLSCLRRYSFCRYWEGFHWNLVSNFLYVIHAVRLFYQSDTHGDYPAKRFIPRFSLLWVETKL